MYRRRRGCSDGNGCIFDRWRGYFGLHGGDRRRGWRRRRRGCRHWYRRRRGCSGGNGRRSNRNGRRRHMNRRWSDNRDGRRRHMNRRWNDNGNGRRRHVNRRRNDNGDGRRGGMRHDHRDGRVHHLHRSGGKGAGRSGGEHGHCQKCRYQRSYKLLRSDAGPLGRAAMFHWSPRPRANWRASDEGNKRGGETSADNFMSDRVSERPWPPNHSATCGESATLYWDG